MTITITLTPEQEMRLLERAAHEGRDVQALAQDEMRSVFDAPLPVLSGAELTRRINEAYAGPPDEDEKRTMEAMRRHQRKLLQGEEW